MQIEISHDLTHGRDIQEVETAVREGLLIRDYLNAEISIGEFSACMDMNYVDGRDWLHAHGIATLKTFRNLSLEKADEDNYQVIATQLGISTQPKTR